MSNRREFLQMSLAASALPAIVAARPESVAPSSDKEVGVGGSHVIVETMSPMALAFGEEAVRLGLEPHRIKDDITDLWCHTLDLQWKRGPATLAGITLSTLRFAWRRWPAIMGCGSGSKPYTTACRVESWSISCLALKASSGKRRPLADSGASDSREWRPVFCRSIRVSGQRRLWNPRQREPGSLAQWFPGSLHPGPRFNPI